MVSPKYTGGPDPSCSVILLCCLVLSLRYDESYSKHTKHYMNPKPKTPSPNPSIEETLQKRLCRIFLEFHEKCEAQGASGAWLAPDNSFSDYYHNFS